MRNASFGETRLQLEQPLRIRGSLGRERFKRNAADFGQALSRVTYVRRLISLNLANRLRRQIRAIRLNENAIVRHRGGDQSQLGRLLKRNHSGEADVKPHREALVGHSAATGERVQYA